MKKDVPLKLGSVYYKDTPSLSVFIPVIHNPDSIKLDSLYFKGQKATLKFEHSMYVANFEYSNKENRDVVMSHESYAEYGNQAPLRLVRSPIKLKQGEALVSYHVNKEPRYFIIEDISYKP
ncbi:hypothetical protein KFZ70_05610 [Tamlana fucoidanivorans]|uniref:Uncharacterized protein n=1 Tax=Allotamlana fucoidanivorans TaxID=2583814 RepID=A0A5C4SRY4_9FLAO|nr:hypothetical protein [Tamlana fucoidanivorans]TNJ47015.1 hypothetical protein FGF67_00365 [Tamlana fucoidanivorans]